MGEKKKNDNNNKKDKTKNTMTIPGNYLHLYATKQEHDAEYNSNAYKEPWVGYTEATDEVSYNKKQADPYNGHDYVDLGLPSGTLWATMNVGATEETDGGLYFAWGETTGYTAEQVQQQNPEKAFSTSWSDYAHGTYDERDAPDYGFTKYNATDGLTTLETEDDAAAANWGGQWHMPTKAQVEELIANTTREWTTVDGVNGTLFTSTEDSTKTMVLPAVGAAEDGNAGGSNGAFMWSASLSDVPYGAWHLSNSYAAERVQDDPRHMGQPVRGVIG